MIKVNNGNKIVLSGKKEKVTVFLDMDGCLSNWLKGACELSGIDLTDKKIRQEIKDKNGFLDGYVDEEVLWKKIEDAGFDFWENLELFSWSKNLYNSLEDIADTFCIFSSPGKVSKIAAQACYGKVIWLEKHFNNSENYLFGYNKHYCVGNKTILVDDSQKKIDLFKEAGGLTFLWPDPLSIIDGDIDIDETIKELVNYIKSV